MPVQGATIHRTLHCPARTNASVPHKHVLSPALGQAPSEVLGCKGVTVPALQAYKLVARSEELVRGMEGRHGVEATKAWCPRDPQMDQKDWDGDTERDTSTGSQEPACGWEEGRPVLSFDRTPYLPSVLCINCFSLQIFVVCLNAAYISNSFNVQSDYKSNPAHCKKHPGFCRKKKILISNLTTQRWPLWHFGEPSSILLAYLITWLLVTFNSVQFIYQVFFLFSTKQIFKLLVNILISLISPQAKNDVPLWKRISVPISFDWLMFSGGKSH